jgi:tRNA(fMet)-specific endonuclease VapC
VYILDTDTLTHLHAGHPRVVERARHIDDSDVFTTIITKIELLRGRYEFLLKAADGAQLLKAQDWLLKTELLLAPLRILPFDAAAATEFDRLRGVTNLRKVGRADLLISSIALAHRATVATRNLRDFRRVANLGVVNWVD